MARPYKNKNQVSVVGDILAPKRELQRLASTQLSFFAPLAHLKVSTAAPKLTRNHMADNKQLVKQIETMAIARKDMADVDAMDKANFTLSRFKHAESKLAGMGFTRQAYHAPRREDDETMPLGGSQRGNQPAHAFLKKKPVADPSEH